MIRVLEDGVLAPLCIRSLPSSVSANRYVFHARRGKISPADVARLEAWPLRAKVFEMDISIDEFDALALQFMYAAEEFVAK